MLQPSPSHHLSLTIFLADSATQRLNALSTAAKLTWLHTCAASARLNNALSRPAQYAQLFFMPPPVAPELPPTKYSQKLAINTAHTCTLLLHSVNSILLFYSDIVHDTLHPTPQTLSACIFTHSFFFTQLVRKELERMPQPFWNLKMLLLQFLFPMCSTHPHFILQ